MDSIAEPSADSEEVDGGEIVSGKFVKALRETTHILKAAEEAFDDIALAVKPFVIGLGIFVVRAIRDDRHGSVIANGLTHMLAVISFIGANGQGRGQVIEKFRCGKRIVAITRRQREGERSSQPVDHGMELRRAAAA